MLRIRIDHAQPLEDQLRPAVHAIETGGIVAFPTDTLYGLAVDPRSANAIAKLFGAKRRTADQPIPLIISDLAEIATAGRLTALGAKLASQFWPGPLSLIIPASSGLSPSVHLSTGSVAVRIPNHDTARALARGVGHAITATSANISGSPAALNADEVVRDLADRIDVLVDDGPAPGGPASTIVDVMGTEPKLVRAGAIEWNRVLEFLH